MEQTRSSHISPISHIPDVLGFCPRVSPLGICPLPNPFFFFFSFLELIRDSQKLAQTAQSLMDSSPTFHPGIPTCITAVQHQKRETDLGVTHRHYSDFTHFIGRLNLIRLPEPNTTDGFNNRYFIANSSGGYKVRDRATGQFSSW